MNKLRVFLAIGFFLLVLTGCSTRQEPDYLELGNDYKNNQQYAQAAAYYREGISVSERPEKELFLQLIDIYLLKNQQQQARELVDNAIAIYPNDTELLSASAQMYMEELDYTSALTVYESIKLLEPENFELWRKMVLLALLTKNDDLVTDLNNITTDSALEEQDIFLRLLLSIKNEEEYDLTAVETMLEDAEIVNNFNKLKIYLDENDLISLADLTFIELNNGNYPEVLILSRLMQEENPFYETGFLYEAIVYINYFDFPQADELLNQLLELNETNTDALIYKLLVETAINEWNDAAVELYNKINENSELNYNQLTLLTEILFSEDQEELLVDVFGKYRANIPIDAIEINLKYLQSLGELAEFSDMLAYIEEIEESASLTEPQEADLQALKAYGLANNNERQTALELIGKTYNRQPNSLLVNYYYGLINWEVGSYEAADEYFTRAKDLDLNGKISDNIAELTAQE